MTPSEQDTWDVVVIGAGSAGENAADYAVKGGLSAALVEAELVGGECSYWACMPSKALLRPVELVTLTGQVGGVVPTRIDLDGALARRERFTHGHDESSQLEWAEKAGIDVIKGRARIAGEREVTVTLADGRERTLRATQAVVVATGSTATIPPVDGLAEAAPWTSRDITNLQAVPRRVLIVGGGVVACESATWLAGLGAEEVTLIEHHPGLLSRNEPFAGELVREGLERLGVDVRLGATLDSVARGPVGDARVGEPRGVEATALIDGVRIVVDEIVVGAGRRPNTHGLGLEALGLDEGAAVEVDDHMAATGVDGDWLYAVGDVNGRALLTHQGKYQARVCGDVIAARAAGRPLDDPRYTASADHGAIPQVVFTDPQVAAVGPTEAEARDGGATVRTVEIDLGSVAGAALVHDDYAGRAKLVIDADAGTLLGATFVGSEVAELLHSATVAVVGGVTLDQLWHAVPSYPTVSEGWLRLLEKLRAEDRAA
jgi:pyruvate/2-oxoglutarate dehydrogenase complex dihydrolipoamide dehydrogenase (E3) component